MLRCPVFRSMDIFSSYRKTSAFLQIFLKIVQKLCRNAKLKIKQYRTVIFNGAPYYGYVSRKTHILLVNTNFTYH